MVGTTGIEPVTPAMSMQCSPAELRALILIGVYTVRMGGFNPIRPDWQALDDYIVSSFPTFQITIALLRWGR